MHIQILGKGQPLVMLHGWGMHGGIWGDAAVRLAEHFELHVVDLPGHGWSVKGETGNVKREHPTFHVSPSTPPSFSLDTIVAELTAQFQQPVNLLGWSLGGQIALRWAQLEPQKIKRLVLVASTPCFAQREDWPCAMPQETLAGFAAELRERYAQTLRRFLALQVRGSEGERELLAELRTILFSRGEPDLAALQSGLEILRDSDQRDALSGIAQPTLVLAGERDTLTPPAASEYMANRMPHARLASIKGAAHAPFLSHPDAFLDALKVFMSTHAG